MFSIAAINDTDAKSQWEPLAPTKEAQCYDFGFCSCLRPKGSYDIRNFIFHKLIMKDFGSYSRKNMKRLGSFLRKYKKILFYQVFRLMLVLVMAIFYSSVLKIEEISVCVPHSKVIDILTADKVLHEINILEVDFLLKTVEDMLKKEMYLECFGLLAPLLFCTKDVHIEVSCMNNKESEGILSVEVAALDVLSKACEKVKPMDVEVKLKCHCRKLQIMLVKAGIPVNPALRSSSFKMSEFKSITLPEELKDSTKQWNHLVAEEVKAISRDV